MAPSFILTSSPFLLSQITLASFVPDVSQPHQDAKRPYAVSRFDYSVQADENFEGVVKTSSESLVEVLATKFAGILIRREKDSTFKATAKRESLANWGALQRGHGGVGNKS